MREILFRGKSNLLGWVEGWYCPEVKWGEHHFPAGITHKTKEGWLDDVVVIPETIGQFTGLTDKNGKKIFEGDVLRFNYTGKNHGVEGKATVIFEHGKFCVLWGWHKEFVCLDGFANTTIEVIGNIHDNPELLENP